VGVLGADDVGEALAALTADRTVNGRRIVVRRLLPDDELAGVHVLFFGEAARARADRIASEAAAQNILTVTDFQAGADDSVIEFVTANGKLRFEVRLDTAESNGLKLHAGLLNVAARVHGSSQR
ncbi:MAG TPA: YfiR family protein, partial [Gammaproteobacteria bacterium]|nr:YfiR family protein [Gammaproteobacteria bacterium]